MTTHDDDPHGISSFVDMSQLKSVANVIYLHPNIQLEMFRD